MPVQGSPACSPGGRHRSTAQELSACKAKCTTSPTCTQHIHKSPQNQPCPETCQQQGVEHHLKPCWTTSRSRALEVTNLGAQPAPLDSSSIQPQLLPAGPHRQHQLKELPKGCSARAAVLGTPGHRASAVRLLAPSSSPSTHHCLLQHAPSLMPHRAEGSLQAIKRGWRLLFHILCAGRAAGMFCPAGSGHIPSRVSMLESVCPAVTSAWLLILPKVLVWWVAAG